MVDSELRMSVEDAAYLAGILDGEGYIGINKGGHRYGLAVAVKTTSRELGEWIAGVTGFCRKLQIRVDKRGDRQTGWEWRVYGHQALQVLATVERYLQVKRQHARLAIEYQCLPIAERKALGKTYSDRIKELNLRRRWQATVGADRSGDGSQPAALAEATLCDTSSSLYSSYFPFRPTPPS